MKCKHPVGVDKYSEKSAAVRQALRNETDCQNAVIRASKALCRAGVVLYTEHNAFIHDALLHGGEARGPTARAVLRVRDCARTLHNARRRLAQARRDVKKATKAVTL